MSDETLPSAECPKEFLIRVRETQQDCFEVKMEPNELPAGVKPSSAALAAKFMVEALYAESERQERNALKQKDKRNVNGSRFFKRYKP